MSLARLSTLYPYWVYISGPQFYSILGVSWNFFRVFKVEIKGVARSPHKFRILHLAQKNKNVFKNLSLLAPQFFPFAHTFNQKRCKFYSDRGSDKSFKDRFRRTRREHWQARERMQGILGSSETHRETRRLHDDESQVSKLTEVTSVSTWDRSQSEWTFLVSARRLGSPTSLFREVSTAKFGGSAQCSINSRQTFFLRRKLAPLQMAPPLITGSVFLPSLLRLPALLLLSPFYSQFYFTLSRLLLRASRWIFEAFICSSPVTPAVSLSKLATLDDTFLVLFISSVPFLFQWKLYKFLLQWENEDN